MSVFIYQAGQKGPGYKAREETTSGGVLFSYVERGVSSATK